MGIIWQYLDKRGATANALRDYGRMKRAEMFIDGYKASLVKDTSYKELWKVSFTLKEF